MFAAEGTVDLDIIPSLPAIDKKGCLAPEGFIYSFSSSVTLETHYYYSKSIGQFFFS